MAVSVVRRNRRKAPTVTVIPANDISIPRGIESKEGEEEDITPDPQNIPTTIIPSPGITIETHAKDSVIISEPPIQIHLPLVIDLTGSDTEDEMTRSPLIKCEPISESISEPTSESIAEPFTETIDTEIHVGDPSYNFDEVWRKSFDTLLVIQNGTTPPQTPVDIETIFRTTSLAFAKVLQGPFFIRQHMYSDGFVISRNCNYQKDEFAASWENNVLETHPWNNNCISQGYTSEQLQSKTPIQEQNNTVAPVYTPTFIAEQPVIPLVQMPIQTVMPTVAPAPTPQPKIIQKTVTPPDTRPIRPNPFAQHSSQGIPRGFPKRIHIDHK